MPENKRSDAKDVEIGAKGVVLRGAYEDVRPIVKQTAGFVSSVIRLLDNAVGLPADFVSYHLEPFRERYQRRVEKIPEAQRTKPPFRVGCAILKEVAFAAEEPDIQQMFAELLATGSDSETKHLVHPGFPEVISQLDAMDATVLNAFVVDESTTDPPVLSFVAIKQNCGIDGPNDDLRLFQASLDNLVRLGLLEWKINRVYWNGTGYGAGYPMVGTISFRSSDSSRSHRVADEQRVIELERSLQRMSDEMGRALSSIYSAQSLTTTEFGRQFIRACVPNTVQSD